MSSSSGNDKRRAFLRGSMTLLPAAVIGSVLAPRVQAADGGDRQQAMDADVRANVLYWGADPSGRRDSSTAFAKVARSQWGRTIHVPPGTYRIAKTVDLHGRNLKGPGRTRMNSGDDEACLMPHYSLDGPMFRHCGPEVASLTFNGKSKKGAVALEASDYNTTIQNVFFKSMGIGILVPQFIVNFNVLQCAFVDCEYGLRVRQRKTNSLPSTTVRLIGNEFNYVDNCVVFDGELYGATFQDNIFEAVKGDAIIAKVIYGSNFIGNWWEKRNGGESDWPAARTHMKQQIVNCFASANYLVYGWKDIFSAGEHNQAMGGVSAADGDLVVRSSTGSATRISPNHIRQETDAWMGKVPFVIQSGYSKAHKDAQPLVFRHTSAKGHVHFDADPEHNEAGVWKGKLRFAARVNPSATKDDKGKHKEEATLWDEYEVNAARPGMVGHSEQVTKKGKVHEALTGMPQFVKWRKGDKDAPGVGFFPTNQERKEGVIELSFNKGEYEFRDPIVTVTVDDSDIELAGIEYLHAYSGAEKYKAYYGFVFTFVTRKDGTPATPSSFNLQLFHPY
ncbi:glycoside hydrolase family 55 protein [Larsenimonas salina]|uniref:glycoside hydrolase family 55 protein n=1 Tax=Larsenimonas salina TaxID=1295565 RepID=UPI002074211D|nr:glycoside hydrolase family 55 protein [Larsenimonas salina]MCM5705003.1 glycoside hydrolase family 55 protein [Larsenimonas salina]